MAFFFSVKALSCSSSTSIVYQMQEQHCTLAKHHIGIANIQWDILP